MEEGPGMRSMRGLALLVVLGVLGVLALLAVAFVTMAQLERKASSQRLNSTKALLLARSGLEDAMARLTAGQDPELGASRYGGEDWDADGIQQADEAAQQVYRPASFDVDSCPVAQAMRPSFACLPGPGSPPRTVTVDGRRRGYTGLLQGDRLVEGNTYALKDHSGGIWVNGGDPASLPTDGYNAVLKRILGTLAEALDREDGTDDGLPLDQVDGEKLVDLRPATGWQNWDQVRDLALGGSQVKLDAFKPYLALWAWTDPKVIRPNPPSAPLDYQSAS